MMRMSGSGSGLACCTRLCSLAADAADGHGWLMAAREPAKMLRSEGWLGTHHQGTIPGGLSREPPRVFTESPALGLA